MEVQELSLRGCIRNVKNTYHCVRGGRGVTSTFDTTPAHSSKYFFMRVESVSPSTEMLRACFEKGFDFTVNYRGRTSVSVRSTGEDAWEITRRKDGRVVSSFNYVRFADERLIESDDSLVEAMVKAIHGPFIRVDHTHFLESVLRVYGGKIAHINSVDLDTETV